MSAEFKLGEDQVFRACRDEATGNVLILHRNGPEVKDELAVTLRCMAEAALRQHDRPERLLVDEHWATD